MTIPALRLRQEDLLVIIVGFCLERTKRSRRERWEGGTDFCFSMRVCLGDLGSEELKEWGSLQPSVDNSTFI